MLWFWRRGRTTLEVEVSHIAVIALRGEDRQGRPRPPRAGGASRHPAQWATRVVLDTQSGRRRRSLTPTLLNPSSNQSTARMPTTSCGRLLDPQPVTTELRLHESFASATSTDLAMLTVTHLAQRRRLVLDDG